MTKTVVSVEEENSREYIRKWNILFDRPQNHWMVCNAREGDYVYACYACKELFSSKTSFINHVNRRTTGLKYYCVDCLYTYKFYNPCSLLLHARKHFQATMGTINLDNVTIYQLSTDLIGFPLYPNIPLIYNVKEEEMSTGHINSSFYNPVGNQKGFKCIELIATFLLFLKGDKQSLVLKQICSNLPKCVFILRKIDEKENFVIVDESKVKGDKLVMHRKVEIKVPVELKELGTGGKCLECNEILNNGGIKHFQWEFNATGDNLKCEICDFVLTGRCSFKAHHRLHQGEPPFVCPECGINFPKFIDVIEHQEKGCYHFAKQMRLKCTEKHCKKIFSYHANYKQHFSTHIKHFIKCLGCNIEYDSPDDFALHQFQHHKEDKCTYIDICKCTMCRNAVLNNFQEHVDWHCDPNKSENHVYVYICKYCRNLFRSPTTYAVHLARCHKRNISLSELVSSKYSLEMSYCTNCDFVIQFKIPLDHCPKCKSTDTLTYYRPEMQNGKKPQCSLCNLFILPARFPEHVCKFKNPVVLLDNIESPRRKRKSSSPNQNSKKKHLDNNPIIIDSPKPFDGTYVCKVCEFKSENRGDFHNHLMEHRGNAVYQCMECGESFVVKPSFEKHLIYFHQINNVNEYIQENDCYDRKLEERLRTDGEEKFEPNQCTVCRAKFQDEFEFKKHIRIHGMAFLLNGSKSTS